MEERSCCFTGHRNIEKKYLTHLEEHLTDLLEKFIKVGIVHFKAGGAIGFDNLASLKVLELKEKYPNVTLDLILPCHGQTKGWPESEIAAYENILSRANSVTYASDVYTNGCMHLRNRMLVDGSSVCIAFCTSQKGGTAYTIRYATENNVSVINLATLIKYSENI